MVNRDKSRGSFIDTSKPSIARVYDLCLGGKDNFAADRALYEQVVALAPEIPDLMVENRKWLAQAVGWLVAEQGIDQFLDCGSGLPTAENTHQVSQRINPEVNVVYVDNDPTVIAYGRALLEDNDRSHFVGGDLSEPREILRGWNHIRFQTVDLIV
ncbi:SAM-dependent methyltransferase [Fodinicola feengrottensis]|uniref:S-adenosyl methyltransferase n=1 Tax=Fodinicola feengrottensis TaxID=435914 RepID=A0ABP4VGK6_9ACTN|nr:SAM-dependent methyltransferase [Fodinicola feengrottensis]